MKFEFDRKEVEHEINHYVRLHERVYGERGSREVGDKATWAKDYLLAEFKYAMCISAPDMLKGRTYLMRMRTGMPLPEMGRFFAKLQKEYDGEPQQTGKTPEQVDILDDFIDECPYPSRVDIQDLVIATGGLSRKQISTWFAYQRKKRDIQEDDYVVDYSNDVRDPVIANHPGGTWRKWDEWFEAVRAGEAELTYESYVESVGELIEGRRY